MERVKILKSIYVEQTRLRYQEGEETTVPKGIANRHIATGHMEFLPEPKDSVNLDKKKPVK